MVRIEVKNLSTYKQLTQYLTTFKSDKYREWIEEVSAILMPDVYERPSRISKTNFSFLLTDFINDVYDFSDAHPEYALKEFLEILKFNGIKWSTESMSEAVVEDLDAQCILALIIGAIIADAEEHGVILEFFENDTMVRWLERLEELDDGEEYKNLS